MKKQNKQVEEKETSFKIRSGTYFGECLGYCRENIILNGKTVVLSKVSNYPDDSYPEIKVEIKNNLILNELLSLIDLKVFHSLPKEIGCPDCYDQGGEYLEISKGDENYRIDFEYEAQIDQISDILTRIRDYKTRLKQELSK